MESSTIKHDFAASVVVFLVALPLCMGIAIASGVPVAAGLITGIVGGIVVGALAGCPLQVSGPAAGLTVIIYEVVREYGLETLGIIVLLAGVLQASAGLLRLGQWFRAVSPAVVKGMLAGIGVLILASQFHVMVDDKPKENGIANLATIPQAIMSSLSKPTITSQESREFRKELLQQGGELHRRQVELAERAAELFPHIHNPDEEFSDYSLAAAKEMLPTLAEQQAQLSEDVQAMAAKMEQAEAHFPSPEKAFAAAAAANGAQAETQTAAAALGNAEPHAIIETQDRAVESLQALLNQFKNRHIAAQLGLLAIGSIVVWQFVPKSLKVVPGPLVAVVLTTAIAAAFSLPVFYVEIPDRLTDGIHLPTWAVWQELEFRTLLMQAMLVAVVASAETLLCATAVDQMQTGQRTNYDRELFAQGVGNTVCGALGVLPMTGVIVRSSANIHAGGKTRLSAILHGVWLLIFVAAFGFLLRQIPTACLAAILVYTGFKLINIKDVKRLAAFGKSEVFIYLATVITIVATDLLTGVLVGVALAAVKLLYTFSHLDARLRIDDNQDGKCVLDLHGAATFIRLPLLAAELERVPDGCELHVDFQHLDYIDHACLELLLNWAKQHEQTGGRLIIDWESLHARFQPAGKRSSQRKLTPTA
ncbi:MAG: SulP family inorganic anion transporter [Planctomycetales bacterium]|nr:SulP family inorganic anion transporter [Planctomycetales bacterium]